MDDVLRDAPKAAISEKMRALLAISDKVRRDGRLVTDDDVRRAKAAGADDRAIHDTVLITAMFCMFNRYVDGLGTELPERRFDLRRRGRPHRGAWLREPVPGLTRESR